MSQTLSPLRIVIQASNLDVQLTTYESYIYTYAGATDLQNAFDTLKADLDALAVQISKAKPARHSEYTARLGKTVTSLSTFAKTPVAADSDKRAAALKALDPLRKAANTLRTEITADIQKLQADITTDAGLLQPFLLAVAESEQAAPLDAALAGNIKTIKESFAQVTAKTDSLSTAARNAVAQMSTQLARRKEAALRAVQEKAARDAKKATLTTNLRTFSVPPGADPAETTAIQELIGAVNAVVTQLDPTQAELNDAERKLTQLTALIAATVQAIADRASRLRRGTALATALNDASNADPPDATAVQSARLDVHRAVVRAGIPPNELTDQGLADATDALAALKGELATVRREIAVAAKAAQAEAAQAALALWAQSVGDARRDAAALLDAGSTSGGTGLVRQANAINGPSLVEPSRRLREAVKAVNAFNDAGPVDAPGLAASLAAARQAATALNVLAQEILDNRADNLANALDALNQLIVDAGLEAGTRPKASQIKTVAEAHKIPGLTDRLEQDYETANADTAPQKALAAARASSVQTNPAAKWQNVGTWMRLVGLGGSAMTKKGRGGPVFVGSLAGRVTGCTVHVSQFMANAQVPAAGLAATGTEAFDALFASTGTYRGPHITVERSAQKGSDDNAHYFYHSGGFSPGNIRAAEVPAAQADMQRLLAEEIDRIKAVLNNLGLRT